MPILLLRWAAIHSFLFFVSHFFFSPLTATSYQLQLHLPQEVYARTVPSSFQLPGAGRLALPVGHTQPPQDSTAHVSHGETARFGISRLGTFGPFLPSQAFGSVG
ncbi:hypothetical protein B0T17DRAFT_367440 [Bombardia bombarda]|uniref:Uncharacterized protein n=1 Tax=Bombardia bombarda TaxID=252184 RepID=A0AA39WIL8_9PEZI|nr:hypothetical protein B0T17DRAFT_367440 [Bombardia bombarda]